MLGVRTVSSQGGCPQLRVALIVTTIIGLSTGTAAGASLINKPGRPCENGRLAPVGRYDWLKWSRELSETSWEIHQAALTQDRAVVSELTNNLAQACDNCHRVYRSNAQQNRMRCLGSGIVVSP